MTWCKPIATGATSLSSSPPATISTRHRWLNLLGANHLIATRVETIDGRYTGEARTPASFAEGKVTLLKQWLQTAGHSLEGSYFYTDSRNDLPLMELADNPVAVNPDRYLAAEAVSRNWPTIHLHNKN